MRTILCTAGIVVQLLLTAQPERTADPSWRCHHPSCRFMNKTEHGIRKKTVTYKFEIEGKPMWLVREPQKIDVQCLDNNVLEFAALPRASSTWNVLKLQLTGCPLPAASSLHAVLTAINVALHCNSEDHESLCGLHLSRIPSTPSLAASHFLGLEQLQTLTIDVDDPITPERNFLVPLQNLSKLFLRNVILPKSVGNLGVFYARSDFNARRAMPVSSSVEKLSVDGWRDPEPQPLSNCEALRMLYVSNSVIQYLPDYWVANCSRLEHLAISKLKNFTLTPKLLFGASSLKSLSFDLLELKMLPARLFNFSPNLQSVQLVRNNLHTLPRDLFANARQVRKLDLSHNDLRVDAIDVLKPLKYLTELDLSSNPGFYDICEPNGYSPLRNMSQLKTLILSGTGVRQICRDWLEDMPRLEWLDLSRSNFSRISFQDLQFKKKAVSVEVLLKYMSLQFTHSTREEFVETRDITNKVTVYFTKPPLLNCSCDSYWTWRTLQLPQIKFKEKQYPSNIHCTNGSRLHDWLVDDFWCQWSDECAAVALPDKCSCESHQDETPDLERWIIRAHCENASLSSFPSLPQNTSFVYDLHLAHNNIKKVLDRDLQHDIRTLDLRNNPLVVVDDVTAKRLDNVKGILRLNGNQLNCSCLMMPFLRALHDRNPSLMEINEAFCSNGMNLFAAVTMDCSSGVPLATWLVLVIVCLASALVLGAATVSFFWSRQRRFFARAVLHRWGWTRRAEENDDRRFDAFLTFSHRDTAVALAVMTRLEPRYRLCVHVRDWTPGEMILTQIVESVQDSRRTVALVSRHFLASKWARAEFREAHLAAMLDERPRLVVVLLEDPRELRMEAQLSGYIATRTYLRWGEAFFWDKLAVALPPPRENQSVEEQTFEI